MKFKRYRKAVERHTDTVEPSSRGVAHDIKYAAQRLLQTDSVVEQVRWLGCVIRAALRYARTIGYSLDELATVDYEELQRKWGTGEFP